MLTTFLYITSDTNALNDVRYGTFACYFEYKTTKKRKPRSLQNKQTQQNSRGLAFATTADVDVNCKTMKMSKHMCDHVSKDILSGRVKGDIRSYRQDNVAYKDRIPAEYRCPSTPPRYWSLEDIAEPKFFDPLAEVENS